MSEKEADWSWIAAQGVATLKMKAVAASLRSRRTAPVTLAIAIAFGPAFVAALLLSADVVWPLVRSAADAATASLYADFEAVRANPGRVVDLIGVALGAALAAVPPSLGIGAFERRPAVRALAAAAFYPGWFVVMLAPGIVLHQFAGAIDPTLMGAHLSSQFLVLFSAAATSIALGYSLLASRAAPPVAPALAEAP